jgi:predicted nuclease of predicted toxin-antitoxin system
MRILLDECLPKDLARELPGHEVQTVPQSGWASIGNGVNSSGSS